MASTSPTEPEYRLADHVRACHVDGQVVLLDLNRDRYIGASGPALAAAAHWISDWPAPKQRMDDFAPDKGVEAWVHEVKAAGLITTSLPTTPGCRRLEEAQESLPIPDSPPGGGIQWRRLANIASSTFIAARWLKRYSMAEIAANVRRMRQGAEPHMALATQDMRTAAGWYLRMRPFAISSQDECLHDSLTLLRFLAAERHYPWWVIGVRTRPFAAHSWVQAGSTVLNDLHENVRGYTPILFV